MTYYCTYCGTPIDENTGVCPYCGAAYTIPTQVNTEVRKRKFPLTAVAIIAVLLVAAIAATLLTGAMVGMFTLNGSVVHNEAVAENVESVTTEDESIMSEVEAEKENSTLALTPEEAVDIYMANMDVWMYSEKYKPIWWGYYLIDLDFDGVLELISGTVNGSGRFADNTYYRIDPDTKAVEQIEDEVEFYGDGYHHHSAAKLYKSKADGTMFYLCYGEGRVSMVEGSMSYGKLYMSGDVVSREMVYSNYYCGNGIDGDPQKTDEYYIYPNGERTEVTKDEYDKYIEDFADENTDLKLNSTVISGSDFDDADFDSQRQQLLEAYRSFSYDGFSFED